MQSRRTSATCKFRTWWVFGSSPCLRIGAAGCGACGACGAVRGFGAAFPMPCLQCLVAPGGGQLKRVAAVGMCVMNTGGDGTCEGSELKGACSPWCEVHRCVGLRGQKLLRWRILCVLVRVAARLRDTALHAIFFDCFVSLALRVATSPILLSVSPTSAVLCCAALPSPVHFSLRLGVSPSAYSPQHTYPLGMEPRNEPPFQPVSCAEDS